MLNYLFIHLKIYVLKLEHIFMLLIHKLYYFDTKKCWISKTNYLNNVLTHYVINSTQNFNKDLSQSILTFLT